jgi:flagellar FliL protein
MVDEPNGEQTPKEKKGKKKILVFSIAGIGLIIAAAFLFATVAVPVPPQEEPPSQAASPEGGGAGDTAGGRLEIFDLPAIMVNLKGTSKKRILKIHMNMMYEAKHPETAAALLEGKMPEIRDALTTLLTEKTLEDLEDKEDLDRLRMELLDEINRVVFAQYDGRAVKLYYQEFLVQ